MDLTWDQVDETWDALQVSTRGVDGVWGDVELRTTAYDIDTFEALRMRGPVGYEPFRELIPGDYRYRYAMLWARIEAPSVIGDTLALAELGLNVDVPDIVDAGSSAISGGGTRVNFSRTFNATPNVTAIQSGGATTALVRISGQDASGFTATLYDASNPASSVAGNINWNAKGY